MTNIDPPAAAGAMAANLAVAGDAVLATWLEPVASSPTSTTAPRPYRLRFARFENGQWGAAATIAEGATIVANWADFPSVAQGEDGALVAHWAEKSGTDTYAYDVLLARSTDGGTSWTRIGPAHDDGTKTEHGFVSLLADGGKVRAFWLDGRETAATSKDGQRKPMTLRSALVGETVTAGELVDASVCDCCGTSAAMTPTGPALVYRDRSDGEIRDIAIARRVDGRWLAPQTVQADGWRIPGCPVNGPAVAARGQALAVAWYTYADDRASVRVVFSGDAGATFGAPIEVDGPRDRTAPLGRVDLALDPGGDAIVSWMASDREQARILARRVSPTGKVGAPLTISETSADRDAGFPRLELLRDTLVVSWTEAADSDRLRAVQLSLAAIPAATTSAAAMPSPAAARVSVGDLAPSLAAARLDGTPVSLDSLHGQVALVNIWATWCEPCRHELPELAQLHKKYAAKGLQIVAISVDQQRSVQEVASYAQRRELPFEVWHDARDAASDTLGIGALPATFLLDRKGVVVWRHDGAVTAQDAALSTAIETALARKP